MTRTFVALDPGDMAWLERTAKLRGLTIDELVREAIEALRASQVSPAESFEQLLERTRGIWTEGSGLEWQNRLRGEW